MNGLGIKWFRATFYRIVNSAGYGVISDNPNITNPPRNVGRCSDVGCGACDRMTTTETAPLLQCRRLVISPARAHTEIPL